MEKPFRIGYGYDIHRLVEGRALILGGVNIPHALGLDGHSDADCLTHALADAILGAMGLPDIGHFFPPGDDRFKGMDSQDILKRAADEARARGYAIANVDISVIAEAPKIAKHIPAMKAILARSMGVIPEDVGVKATTNEKVGDLGKGIAIAASAVALLQKI